MLVYTVGDIATLMLIAAGLVACVVGGAAWLYITILNRIFRRFK